MILKLFLVWIFTLATLAVTLFVIGFAWEVNFWLTFGIQSFGALAMGANVYLWRG
jgi:hypothetical protein